MHMPQMKQTPIRMSRRDLGLRHLEHPWLGRRVVDLAHGGRVGVLRGHRSGHRPAHGWAQSSCFRRPSTGMACA